MRGAVVVMLLVLAACGRPDVQTPREEGSRIEPSKTTPGVQVSGDARFGVKRSW